MAANIKRFVLIWRENIYTCNFITGGVTIFFREITACGRRNVRYVIIIIIIICLCKESDTLLFCCLSEIWYEELFLCPVQSTVASGSLSNRWLLISAEHSGWLQLVTYIHSEGSNSYYVNSPAIFFRETVPTFLPKGLHCWTNLCPAYTSHF